MAAACLLAGCAVLTALTMLSVAGPAAAQQPYTVSVAPLKDPALSELIIQASGLISRQASPPLTRAGLRRRIETDRRLLDDLLRSEGYYAGRVRIREVRGSRIGTDQAGDGDARLRRILISADPGPAFTLRRYSVHLTGPQNGLVDLSRYQLPEDAMKTGDRLEAMALIRLQEQLVRQYADQGFPFADVPDRRVVIDHATRTADVDITLDTGPQGSYGAISLTGNQRTDDAYVRRLLGLRSGRRYSQKEIDEAKKRLLATGLFSTVTIDRPDRPTAFGAVPLEVTVVERSARQLRLSAGLSSRDGINSSIQWQHRNLGGEGQAISLSASASRSEISGAVNFEWPDFLGEDRSLYADLTASAEELGGSEVLSLEAGIGIEAAFPEYQTALRAGIGLEALRDRAGGTTTDYLLASVPLRFTTDQSNDAVDPTRGFRIDAQLTPYVDFNRTSRRFLRAEVTAQGYMPLGSRERTVLASWTRAGSVLGEDLANLPTNKRFFAGGSGSVRGYDRDSLSAAGQTGARSLVEGGIELRQRIAERFGLAVFVEGAVLSDRAFPSFTEETHIGGGIGVRYYSGFGPLRVDIAAPEKSPLDISDLRVVVGLGQAF